MITLGFWVHPKTGAERVYLNGHRFSAILPIWLEKCPATGAALLQWKLAQKIPTKTMATMSRRGFYSPYDAAMDAAVGLDLSDFERLKAAAQALQEADRLDYEPADPVPEITSETIAAAESARLKIHELFNNKEENK